MWPIPRIRSVWGVSDKTAPRVLDRWQPEKRASVSSVAVGDGVVYVAGVGLGAWVLEAKGAVPATPAKGRSPVNASWRPPPPAPPEGFHRWLPADAALDACVTGLAVRGDVCYAAAGTAGLYLLELSAQGIRELERVPLAECMDVAVAGNRLFVAAGYEGWIVHEIEAPDVLREMARVPSAAARDIYAYGDGTRWAAFNATVYDIANLSNPRPLVCLVHQARYNKFLSPDLIGDSWVAGNSALKHFAWADLSTSPVKEVPVMGYQSHMGGMCAFGDRAFVADRAMWAILAPGKIEMEALRQFPGKKGAVGLPRWNRGAWVSLSGMGQAAAIWDFSERANPRLIRFFELPCATDPASFWRETLVFPAHRQGVLLPQPTS